VAVVGAAMILCVPKTCVAWADVLLSAVPRPVPPSRSQPVRTCDDLRLVGLKLIFLTVSGAMSLLRLSRREEWLKDAEILMLRHQLAVALQRAAPRCCEADMAGPGVAGSACRTLPIDRLAGMRLIVTPATILRWHRDIVRRRWARRSRRGRSGRPPVRRDVRSAVLRLARENEGTVALVDRGWPETSRVTAHRTGSVFAGFRFPPAVISLAVRWYLR
jgi:hypothetical protein